MNTLGERVGVDTDVVTVVGKLECNFGHFFLVALVVVQCEVGVPGCRLTLRFIAVPHIKAGTAPHDTSGTRLNAVVVRYRTGKTECPRTRKPSPPALHIGSGVIHFHTVTLFDSETGTHKLLRVMYIDRAGSQKTDRFEVFGTEDCCKPTLCGGASRIVYQSGVGALLLACRTYAEYGRLLGRITCLILFPGQRLPTPTIVALIECRKYA